MQNGRNAISFRTAYGVALAFPGLGLAGVTMVQVAKLLRGELDWMIALSLGAWLLGIWTAVATRYVLQDGVLYIRGPRPRQVPVESIVWVSDRQMEGPMFGFGSDFIGIECKGGTVNVSPHDPEGFKAALRAHGVRVGGRPRVAHAGSNS